MRDSVHPGEITVVFSGDLGRYGVPCTATPNRCPTATCWSSSRPTATGTTKQESVLDQIREDFKRTIHKQGVVLMPSFAVGRTQLVTLILRDLMIGGDLAEVPIHIDSPMAIDATAIYSRHLYDCNLDEEITLDGRSRLFPFKVHLHRTVHESKQLNNMQGPRVIIAASGMMTGGRILHHLKQRLPDHHNLVLLTGYQADGHARPGAAGRGRHPADARRERPGERARWPPSRA